MPTEQVLVTGGTGFVGAHCIAQLLEQGYRVRTTVRSLTREGDVRAMLAEAGADASALQVVQADLLDDAGWPDAVAGAPTCCMWHPRSRSRGRQRARSGRS